MFAQRSNWKLAPNRLATTLERLRANGSEVLDLSESNPTRCGLQYDADRILSALADRRALEYCPEPKGLRSAREAITNYYRDRSGRGVGVEVNPENIVLSASTSEGYSFLFRLLCNPGDEVLVPAPSYPLFDYLAGLHDVKLVPYSLLYDHGWQIDLHSVEQALSPRTRAVIVVHPNNPTGSYVKPNEAEALNHLCAQRELAIIADEVFLDFPHDNESRFSFAENQSALTFTLSGLSKISALPQMKVAWVVTSGPSSLVQPAIARLEIIADTFLTMNAPLQLATPTMLEQRHRIRQQLQERIRANLAQLDQQIARQTMTHRLEIEGGWYAVLRVPVTRSDEELAVDLLEKKQVLVHPGHFYDFPAEGYLVVSLITPTEKFGEGIRRTTEFLSA